MGENREYRLRKKHFEQFASLHNFVEALQPKQLPIKVGDMTFTEGIVRQPRVSKRRYRKTTKAWS